MFKANVKSDVQTDKQITNIYNESNEYTDQSVKDTLINSYMNRLVNSNEDITESIKSFENNVDAVADTVQRNTLNFGVCMDITDFKLEQKNKLVQDVEQGFKQLEQSIKQLKRGSTVDTKTDTDLHQAAIGKTDSEQDGSQEATSEQDTMQETKQESYKFKKAMRAIGSGKIKALEAFSALHRKAGINMNERNMFDFGVGVEGRFIDNWSKGYAKGFIEDVNTKTNVPTVDIGELDSKKDTVNAAIQEPFCLFGCADVQSAVKTSEKINNETQIDHKTNIQTKDIYEKVETAYDKCIETVNKIVEQIDSNNTSKASASAIQINELNFTDPKDMCMMKVKGMDIKQSNDLKQNVALTTMIESISSLSSDNEVKAIMADMLGLTQTSNEELKSSQKSKQKASSSQKSQQKSEQKTDNSGNIILIIVIVIIVIAFIYLMVGSGSSFDRYFDAAVAVGMGSAMGRNMVGAPAIPGAPGMVNNMMNNPMARNIVGNVVNNAVNGMMQPSMRTNNGPMTTSTPAQQPITTTPTAPTSTIQPTSNPTAQPQTTPSTTPNEALMNQPMSSSQLYPTPTQAF